MQIDLVRMARAALEAGSFTSAAERMDVDPSAVSRAVAQLERILGFRLFERSTRRIAPTEAGLAYLQRVGPLLTDLEAAAEEARDLVARPRGRLRIAASTAFGQVAVLPMLKTFREENPDVMVDLRLDDRVVDLVSDGVDVAVRLSPEAPADIVVRRLLDTRYRVVASPEWQGAHRLIDPGDLEGVPCVTFPFPGFRNLWRFRNTSGDEQEVPITGGLEITGALALADAARRGHGPALLADWLIAADLEAGSLVDVFPDHLASAGRFDSAAWLLYPSRAYLPLKTRRFIDALTRHLRK